MDKKRRPLPPPIPVETLKEFNSLAGKDDEESRKRRLELVMEYRELVSEKMGAEFGR